MADFSTGNMAGRNALYMDTNSLIAQMDVFKKGVQRKIMRNGLKAGASIVNKAAKANAKQINNTVSKAIGIKTVTNSRKNQVSAIVGVRVEKLDGQYPSNIDYLLEYGTKPHTIQAKNAKALAFGNADQRTFPEDVMHPGAAPQPFLRPAMDATQSSAQSAIQQSIVQALNTAANESRNFKR